jgi:hypothetical protein
MKLSKKAFDEMNKTGERTMKCGHWMWIECHHCKTTICAYCGKSRKQIDKEDEYAPVSELYEEIEQ